MSIITISRNYILGILLIFISLTMFSQVPDLGIQDYFAGAPGATHYKGEEITWSFTAQNTGNANATVVDYKVVLSEDQNFDASDILLKEGKIAENWLNLTGLDAGKTISHGAVNKGFIKIPLNIEANQTYYFIFWIEQDIDGGEINAVNNAVTQKVFIGLRNLVSVVAKDGTPLGIRRPLLLVHGWQPDNIPAEPNIDIWNNFVYYYGNDKELQDTFKIYYVRYWSNLISIDDIGHELRYDLDAITEFQGKQLSIVAHSMGGLVSRSFMNRSVSSGFYANQKGGVRVEKLITLGTPHHGSPMSNGVVRQTVMYPVDFLLLTFFDFNFSPVQYYESNRSDLRWDNYRTNPELFNYVEYPEENNNWLAGTKMNLDTTFDSKIIAYAGSFFILDQPIVLVTSNPFYKPYVSPTTFVAYKMGNKAMHQMWLFKYQEIHSNDGIVPKSSALFYGHTILNRRYLATYNHTRIGTGKSNYYAVLNGDEVPDENLFSKIKTDLLDIELDAQISVIGNNLDYPDTALGNITSKNIQIQNLGDLPLTVTSVQRIGVDSINFNFNISVPFEILPFQTDTIILNFQPTTIGSKTIDFRINNSSTNNPELTVSFSGEAVDTAITDYNINTEPEYDFDEVYINGNSSSKIISFSNSSSAAYTVSSIQVSGVDVNQFSIIDSPVFPLPMNPGDSETIIVNFDPDSIGNKTATLTAVFEGTSNTSSASLIGSGTDFYENPNANKIVKYEYWFDNNYENVLSIELTQSQINNLDDFINATSLAVGIHTLHLRFKDKNGQWSSITSEFFTKHILNNVSPQIINYEYWFNDDYENKVSINITPNQIILLDDYIDATSLDIGLHKLHLRFKDNNQQWSSVVSGFISRDKIKGSENLITSYRYWFNYDDTNMNTNIFAEPKNINELNDELDTSLLVDDTNNTIHIQFKDNRGQWSSVLSEEFYKCGNVTTPTVSIAGTILTSSLAVGYQWYLNGVLIEGASNQTYEVIENGNYSVIVSDSNECKAVSIDVNFSALSVEDFIKTYGVNVYPNPSEGILKLANPNNLEGILQIYDMLGREILINKILPSTIDLTSYAKGIYFIRIIIDNNVFIKNVIIK